MSGGEETLRDKVPLKMPLRSFWDGDLLLSTGHAFKCGF